MRLRPSLEAVYALLAMDQMAVWTAERGRGDREFVQLACETWRTAMRERKEAPNEDHLQPTMGPLAVHLLVRLRVFDRAPLTDRAQHTAS